jgi:hypothetical protein
MGFRGFQSAKVLTYLAPGALAVMGCLIAIPSSASAFDEEAEVASDALVFAVPDDLTVDSIAAEAGPDVAAALTQQIQALYNTGSSSEERLAAAASLRTLSADIESASLRQRVVRRTDLIEAGLTALQTEPAPSEDVAKLVNDLVTAANAFEGENNSTAASIVRANYRALKDSQPAVLEVLKPALMQHYFNHNLHITLSETLLTKLVTDYQTKTGGIADCILGAWVTGTQVTDTRVSANIRASDSVGKFDLVVHGDTRSRTQGRKDPATIFTHGNHHFTIHCPVTFDGQSLTAGTSTIDVDANNTTVGASTDYDGIPIFGSIARKIAISEARKKRGQSEAIAAYKLARQAIPEFQTEVNEKFSEANTSLQDELLKGLNDKGVAPDSYSARSSETHLALSSRTMGTERLGGSPQPFAPLPLTGIAIQLHETALNNAIDGLKLNGRAIPEDELVSELEKSLGELLQREISLTDGEDVVKEEAADDEPPATFVFSQTDPIRIRFEDGKAVLMMRSGIRQEGKDEIPEQKIAVPIGLSIEGGKLVLSPPERVTEIVVAGVERASRLQQVARANQIRRLLKSRLPRRELDPVITVPLSDTRDLDLTLIDIQSNDGWLYTEMQ